MSGELISVVAPVYDEVELVDRFVERVAAALTDERWELVLVDDGSTDGTTDRLRAIARDDERVRVVLLSRNFGHQVALSAGLDRAHGDCVVSLDSDLQDPPEVIPRLVERWRDGTEVVVAVRSHRPGESRFKLASAGLFYRGFRWAAAIDDVHLDAGDFRLLDRRAHDALVAMPERHRFLRGMSSWIGFEQATVTYEREARTAGATKFSLARMVAFASDALLSFSARPLQLVTLLGFAVSALAFVAIVLVFFLRLNGSYLPGFSTITIIVLLLGGVQLIAVGLLGEYLARIYDEVKRRPLYVVRETLNDRPDAARGDDVAAPRDPRPGG